MTEYEIYVLEAERDLDKQIAIYELKKLDSNNRYLRKKLEDLKGSRRLHRGMTQIQIKRELRNADITRKKIILEYRANRRD